MNKYFLFFFLTPLSIFSQSKFAQLEQLLPTPNEYRNASGAPGYNYYQQKADYKINVSIDENTQILKGEETITYTNNSPDQLNFLWLQLDQNIFSQDSDKKSINIENMKDFESEKDIKKHDFYYDGGFNIEDIKSLKGEKMRFSINKTMMRIDLEKPLLKGSKISFQIKWNYLINNRMEVGGRSGYEYCATDKNYIFTIAQWFPRMCVYNDITGWQNKQFLGSGEFTLPFGDYEVQITVPSDHLVAATGEIQNQKKVLTPIQISRLKTAKNSNSPIFITTPEEALANEKSKSSETKTWNFKAENVRDFAFASSRKFIWDVQSVHFSKRNVLAMSFYPKEGNPLWERYSTKLVAHTLKTYSKYTVEYPYPVAISVHSKSIGMEYPMISFNGGRPNDDGTYSESTKYSMWGVVIHEVGHNFFPMIINSDERQWSWMDEGLNTFVQYLTEQEWERDFPSKRGPAPMITDYMRGDKDKMTPTMTNSESILQFGNNAYAKPAAALNILRETILGRELFDYAFKIYCERWKFKHPTPADFFRTIEDVSAVDLDWFWRGWFYSTENVDIALSGVKAYQYIGDKMNEITINRDTSIHFNRTYISEIINKKSILNTVNELDKTIDDLYTKDLKNQDIIHQNNELSQTKKDCKIANNKYYYEVSFENIGGLVSPLIIKVIFKDSSSELIRIPAEIWVHGDSVVSKVFILNKEVNEFILDPFLETADTNLNNNSWPLKIELTQFQEFQKRKNTK